MQNERIKTEEHIEYDSDDSTSDGSSTSSSKSSHHKLEPEVQSVVFGLSTHQIFLSSPRTLCNCSEVDISQWLDTPSEPLQGSRGGERGGLPLISLQSWRLLEWCYCLVHWQTNKSYTVRLFGFVPVIVHPRLCNEQSASLQISNPERKTCHSGLCIIFTVFKCGLIWVIY